MRAVADDLSDVSTSQLLSKIAYPNELKV